MLAAWHQLADARKLETVLPRGSKSKNRKGGEETSNWSTGLVFATLILLTALMFILAKKIATDGLPPLDSLSEIRAKR